METERIKIVIEWEIQGLVEKMNGFHFPEANSERIPDESDQASAILERDMEILFKDRERIRLKQLQNALNRFENGSFGICEACGSPIPEKRLELNPVTPYCVTCQNRVEGRMGERIH
jgi:DnaK suppressor protein